MSMLDYISNVGLIFLNLHFAWLIILLICIHIAQLGIIF